MRKITKFLIPLFVFLILIAPALSFADDPIIPCTNTPEDDGKILPTNACDFNDFFKLIENVIKFMILKLALPIAAIMFTYAGFLMVTGGGEAASARTKAKGIFFNAIIGLVLAAAAWLIVKAILSILGYTGGLIEF